MELTNENYHSVDARLEYMGSSQFKDFLSCEYDALQKVKGLSQETSSKALLVGSYVDAHFSGEMEQFSLEHPEIFNKNGTLKSDFVLAEDVIQSIEQDEMLMKYLSGEHQVIMTGEIAGVKYKIKIDSYFPDKAIIDQKVMKDLQPVWIERKGKNVKVNFVEAYRYDIQGAIYQEIVRQNTGKKLPFILAVATKETVPSKALLEIDQEDLDKALQLVLELSPRFDAIKKGEIEPEHCGKCDSCKKATKVTGVFSYHTIDPDYYED